MEALVTGVIKKSISISLVVRLPVEDLRHRTWENLFTVISVAIARSQNVHGLSGELKSLHFKVESFCVKEHSCKHCDLRLGFMWICSKFFKHRILSI